MIEHLFVCIKNLNTTFIFKQKKKQSQKVDAIDDGLVFGSHHSFSFTTTSAPTLVKGPEH